ncbi:hypothetical protein QPK87_39070 [Kamptonema cortianum]|nr:hypothetical protein [Kamptonema cortianum]
MSKYLPDNFHRTSKTGYYVGKYQGMVLPSSVVLDMFLKSKGRCLLVAAFAVFSSLAFASSRIVSLDVKVTFKPGLDKPEIASALASGYGKVIHDGEGYWIIRLTDPKGAPEKLAKMAMRSSVKEAKLLPPQLPEAEKLKSGVSFLRQTVDEYKEAYIIYGKATGDWGPESEDLDGDEMPHELPGLDFLEAYLQHKELRAYPNEQIDFTGFNEYVDERTRQNQQMTPIGRRDSQRGSSNKFNIQAATAQGNWQYLGPTNLSVPYRIYFGLSPCNGRIGAVAIDHTNPNVYYAGGAQGGIWKSTDAGVNWTPLGDNWPTLGVSSIAISPSDPNLVLAGTGDHHGFDVAGIGVMRSTDGGATWTRVATNMGSSCVATIVFNPANPNQVVAVTGRTSNTGIYRSTDAGLTWTRVVSGGNWGGLSLGMPDGTGQRYLWATSAGNPGLIYRSTDFGASWTSITSFSSVITGNQGTFDVAASKSAPGTVYVLAPTPRKVIKSVDGGATWTDSTAGFPNGSSNYNWSQGWYDYHISTSTRPNGSGGFHDVVYVQLIDINISIDGGASWRNMGGSNFTAAYTGTAICHQDHHSFAIDPNDPNKAIVGSDGGVYRFTYNPTNDTVSWDRLSANLGVTQFYTLAVHPTNPNYIKGGTQDNATPHTFGNTASWGNPGAGDGAGCAINPFNTNFQYNSSQYHGLSKTTNGYASKTGFKPNFGSDRVPFIGKMWLDPNNGRYLYVNTDYLWRYDEDTDTWSARIGGVQHAGGSSRINAMDIALGDSNRLVTGTGDGRVWLSTNFGANWTRIDRQGQSGGLPNRAITSVSINPTNHAEVLVGFSGSGDHLYRCTNVNAATPTWTSVNGGSGQALPNVSLNSIARDPWFPNDTWYVGTDLGVFMTRNAGATWTDITQSRGLPNVQVNEVIANKTTKYLTAATFGRGMWNLKIVPADVSSVVVNTIVSGDSGIGTVTIDRVAPAGGVEVALASSNPSVASVPATVVVPEGSTSATFPISTPERDADAGTVISATIDTTVNANLTVLGARDFYLSRYSLGNGTRLSGSLSSLSFSDDVHLVYVITDPSRSMTTLFGNARSPSPTPSIFRLDTEISSTVAGLDYRVLLYDKTISSFRVVASGVTSLGDTPVSVDLTGTATNYLNSFGDMQYAIEVENNGNPVAFQVRLDRIRWRIRS